MAHLVGRVVHLVAQPDQPKSSVAQHDPSSTTPLNGPLANWALRVRARRHAARGRGHAAHDRPRAHTHERGGEDDGQSGEFAWR